MEGNKEVPATEPVKAEESQEKLMTYSEAKESIKKELYDEMADEVFKIAKQRIQKAFIVDDRYAIKEEVKKEEPQKESPVNKDQIQQMVQDAIKKLHTR